MQYTVGKQQETDITVDIIQIINEFNIPWVIRGNILTLLGEQEFVELVFNNETKEFNLNNVKLEVTQ